MLKTHCGRAVYIYVCRVIRGINSESFPVFQSREFYEKEKNDHIPVGAADFSLVEERSWPLHRMLQFTLHGNSLCGAG